MVIHPTARSSAGLTKRIVAGRRMQLEAFPFHNVASSLVLSSEDISALATSSADTAATAATTASDASAAFTDQIDFFGDPTVRTLFLAFGAAVLVLAGLSVLSQKMDSAIENVLVDFESVMTTNPEFRSRWEKIELQLQDYENNDGMVEDEKETEDRMLKRKQKLFEIMEEIETKEPDLMKRISSKMTVMK